ncbi:GNAT family N-acetyltransferase [Streptomyces ficellus]|uniref:GNAT family N-acetyltransferase n=1 Tax=Streptomyces ficellus TaxID=1977088 RepID=A0A6I6FEQ8_9ACTN|nr:GNAT family N-acetyltransferase [Streptomyces ficellus]QGV82140.1 GNAT family N-acetyltransferase [Streptomyces ficellus]
MPMMRRARVSDHRALVESAQRWRRESRSPAGAREPSLLLPRLFLHSFAGTSLVAEDSTGIKAFLIGLHAADNEEDAHIHFVGVDPALRGRGLARGLYSAFFERAAEAGRREVRAVTTPWNTGSIAFHRALGFDPVGGDVEVGGLPVHRDYDGPGKDRVCFRRRIGSPTA